MHDLKLLLVDDEERFLATTLKLLDRLGYDAQAAIRGRDALELLEKTMVHVVVLDVKMPGLDGIATLKEIKRRFPLVEVIMLTGHATVDSAIEGMQCGAADYLMKPVDLEVLIEKALAAFLKRKRIDEKIRSAKAPQSISPTGETPGKVGG